MKLSVPELKDVLGVPRDVDIGFSDISSSVASLILAENNPSNRKINKNQLKKLVGQLERGEYFLSTDCIGFDSQGNLTNGQHRLSAVSMMDDDKMYRFGVMFNVNNNMDQDTGKRRTVVENALLFDGYDSRLKENGRAVCIPIIQIATKFMLGRVSSYQYSQQQYVKIINFFAEDLIICADAGLFKPSRSIPKVAQAAMFVAYLCGVRLAVLKQIITTIDNHDFSGEANTPVFILYSKLNQKKSSGTTLLRERYCLTQDCIRAVDMGSVTTRLCATKFLYVFKGCNLLK